MSALVSNEFDFSDYVKKQAGQIENCKVLVVDIDAIKDAPDEFLQALNNCRMLCTTRIIILASGRVPGDENLNNAFCSGIYDIIVAENEAIESELKHCILKGKKFKDSVRFQTIEKVEEENKPNTIIKEKLIVKNKVRKVANKETIGFIGVQSRTGVTHNTIVCAEYLKEYSFSVAVIEIKRDKPSDYKIIKEWFEIDNGDSSQFTLHDIDFYPDCELDDLHLILSKNYSFFLIDFGVYRKELENEFIRTGIPIVVGCSKPWEIENMNNIFSKIHIDFLQEFNYLFNFTQEDEKESLQENMKPMHKIFFQDYLENPFNGKEEGTFKTILKEYLPEVRISSSGNNFFNKIGGLLKKNDRKEEKNQESNSL